MLYKHTCIIAIIVLTLSVQFECVTSNVKNKRIASLFEALGYSPLCVAGALTSCERLAKPDCNYLMPELKSLLQNITGENKAISVTENTKKIEQLSYICNNLLQNLTNIFNISATQELEQNIAIKTIIENITTFHNDLLIINNDFRNNIIIEIKKVAKEEVKTNIEELKTLIYEVKNISSEILSVHSKIKHCDEASEPDGVTTVYPYKRNVSKSISVLCDQTTDGGGWTVIQNRDSKVIRQDFNRSWSDYVEGFGDVEGEFWLGLDNIHALTKLTPMELRVDLEDYDGVKKWAKYDLFIIGDASTKYVLTLGKYSGDSLAYHNGMKFSTYDQDNDEWSKNCALMFRGGWWFKDSFQSNLNGYQHVGKYSSLFEDGIEWDGFRSEGFYSLKKASMKIRPKSRN